MRAYLSGPMTGMENYNFPEFFRIAGLLRNTYGWDVVSPAEHDIENGWVVVQVPGPPDRVDTCDMSEPWCCPDSSEHTYVTSENFDYEAALALDCKLVRECDAIVLMPGWEASSGARRELEAAIAANRAMYEWRDESSSVWQRASSWAIRNIALAEFVNETKPIADLPAPQPPVRKLRSPEQHEILGCFLDMLTAVTGDGGEKRAAGTKPSWKVDNGHEGAIFSHITKWKRGELVDPDSGVHPLVHAAWRCLAIAAQESNFPPAPDGASLDWNSE